MTDLLRRHAALDKVIAKYQGRPFNLANADCIRMLRTHLVALGHKKLPRLPHYSTPVAALRALRQTGHENLESLLDTFLPRIAPANMWPGDVALLPGEQGELEAVTLCVGHKVFGWHHANDLREPVMVIVTGLDIKTAYRT